jgi:hypothetical protein
MDGKPSHDLIGGNRVQNTLGIFGCLFATAVDAANSFNKLQNPGSVDSKTSDEAGNGSCFSKTVHIPLPVVIPTRRVLLDWIMAICLISLAIQMIKTNSSISPPILKSGNDRFESSAFDMKMGAVSSTRYRRGWLRVAQPRASEHVLPCRERAL